MNTIIVIPARYASTRLPAKPLADINGKPMIQHVVERLVSDFENVYVATDDIRIQTVVEGFGGKAVMTSKSHQSGTDRCREAVHKVETKTGKDFDVVINVQGDEPLIDTTQIFELEKAFENPETKIATLIKEIEENKEIFDRNIPKVVTTKNKNALYFSRQAIPFLRNIKQEDWVKNHIYYKHIGLYAYRKEVLGKITSLNQSGLEVAEKLEQNRWIENGYPVICKITKTESFSVDTEDDLLEINSKFKKLF
ncbi:MAG: 3-deoxy-manno-octulosonate cytidylyltransferase [Bacteroidota bacterium]|nr:3-deoxy-manno-octulosonate cytidylyltransferase [Bacteroidota bacterium]